MDLWGGGVAWGYWDLAHGAGTVPLKACGFFGYTDQVLVICNRLRDLKEMKELYKEITSLSAE
jgi:hypothetical protein